MKLTDDFDEEPKGNLPLVYMGIGVSTFILFILVLILVLNRDTFMRKKTNPNISVEESEVNLTVEGNKSDGNMTADQLDIWDFYPSEEKDEQNDRETNIDNKIEDKSEETNNLEQYENHTKIINEKGEEEWIPLLPYLTKNNYEITNFVFQKPLMKYYVDSSLASFCGVDISKNESYIDFHKLKKAGIDFVMIRVGARGYSSGQLIMDEYFEDHLKGAMDAGISVGLYFYSQANTEAEAKEEAELVVETIGDRKITYPIAFVMEDIKNDTSRIDELKKEELTKIASTFLSIIKENGFNPLLYGSKEWLLTKVNLMKLLEYDIWLSQEEDIPDYPYKFSMWQYTQSGSIDGIAGKANLNISFIDYDLK